MKPVLRWHDFGSGREARRRQYREYWQGARQSPEAKLAPALRIVAKIGAGFVGFVAHIRDMRCLVLRATTDFDRNPESWREFCLRALSLSLPIFAILSASRFAP